MASLYNVAYEKNIIAGVMRYPELYSELSLLQSNDFSVTNSPIWQIISQTIENKGNPNPLILTEKLNQLGIKLEGIETFDYLNSLTLIEPNKKAVIDIAKELKKLSLIRSIYNNAEKLKKQVVELKAAPASEIFKALNDTLGNSITMLDSQDGDAVNLYDRLEDFIEEKGNNPVDEVGYKMPFELWNKYYGGLRRGELYFSASRSGQGKSTFLSYIGDSVANESNPGMNIKVLFLDTEMKEEDQMIRLAAARIGCPFNLIDTGQWRQSEEWCPKVRAGLKKLKSENRNLWFKQVASVGIDDLVNFVKRWYYKNVGKGGNCVIIYDYLKVLAGDGDGKKPEWQVALDKMQSLKNLAVEIDAPIFTALQVTRAGTTTNKQGSDVVDDESVLSISGRIDWLVAFGAILRRKTPDEIAADGLDFGTHKLIPLKTRYQGRASSGHHDLVKVMEKGKVRYKQNYLCFDIDNFNVEERGCFRTIADLNGWTKLPKQPTPQDNTLL